MGAEIGVFAGLFSTILLGTADLRRCILSIPGEKSTGHSILIGAFIPITVGCPQLWHSGLLRNLFQRHAHETRAEVLVEYSTIFLSKVPVIISDWIYLDSTHSIECKVQPQSAKLAA